MNISTLLVEYAVAPGAVDTATPRFTWILSSLARAQSQSAYQVVVSAMHATGAPYLQVWDSGKVVSAQTTHIPYDGAPLQSNTQYNYTVTVWDQDDNACVTEGSTFTTALLGSEEWRAGWIGAGGPLDKVIDDIRRTIVANRKGGNRDEKADEAKALKEASKTTPVDSRSVLLRKELPLQERPVRALLHVSGLGYYKLHINGERVGDRVLAPSKTDYRLQVLYDTYDVTSLLSTGDNAVGIHLGNGWYHPQQKYWGWQQQFHGSPRATLQLHLFYKDGRKQVVESDGTWKTASGPVVDSCIIDGETYDANLEKDGWDASAYDDSQWEQVKTVSEPGGRLRAHTLQPITVNGAIRPIAVAEPRPDVYIFDMGQNFAGWAKLTVSGEKGTIVTLRYAENMGDDGMLDTTTNNRAEATDRYTLKGKGQETYQPLFCYHGFRYVEVTGFPGRPTADNVEGIVVHTAVEQTGSFDCSHDLINRIHHCTVWSQKSNLMGVPTDCPQRDERLGWLGDAHATAEEAMHNFDMPLFYTKWLRDIQAQQDDNGTGDIPHVSPRSGVNGTPDWSSAYPLILWYACLHYGDLQLLQQHYRNCQDYVAYLGSTADEHIVPPCRYGDWCSPLEGHKQGEPALLSTAYYFYDVSLLARFASVLGRQEDHKQYAALADSIKSAFNAMYFNKDSNQYGNGSQCENAVPLFFGLAPEAAKEQVLDNLVRNITTQSNGHLSTGIIGTNYMMNALAIYGRSDVGYQIATKTGYPSWESMIRDRTTLSEKWNATGTNNHVMFGGVDAWFYRVLAGLNIDEQHPGFEHILIKPTAPAGLTKVAASIETIRGTIASAWEKKGDTLRLSVAIPPNTTATVLIPATKHGSAILREGDGLVWDGTFHANANGVVSAASADAAIKLEVASGMYEFVLNHHV